MMETILITGSQGQIGRELVPALGRAYPTARLLGVGRTPLAAHQARQMIDPSMKSHNTFIPSPNFSYEVLDVRDLAELQRLAQTYNVTTIYHLASLLSAKGEQHPSQCWDINVNGLKNILDVAKQLKLRVFWPSSIAVFGPQTQKILTPQVTVTSPSSMYGITKVTGELLCQYYVQQYEVDIRSLRLPGMISYQAPPGGGTTDYAVEMFYGAVQSDQYDCFVTPDTRLPMMYMPDCIKGILMLMQATLTGASRPFVSYNLTSFSPAAAELVAAIKALRPEFTCRYQPDYRQAIAESWPSSIDDTQARQDWGWQPDYDLPSMVKDMLTQLSRRYAHGSPNTPPIPIHS